MAELDADTVLQRAVWNKVQELEGGADTTARFKLPDYTEEMWIKVEYTAAGTIADLDVFLGDNSKDANGDAEPIYSFESLGAIADNADTDDVVEGSGRHGEVVKGIQVKNNPFFKLKHPAPSAGTVSIWVMPQ